ncbi:MAG TPA: ROK family glucokinase [Acidimicrobiales bacterium]|nr:ROK family glucokinase [Acidimicrobiales bacterium]
MTNPSESGGPASRHRTSGTTSARRAAPRGETIGIDLGGTKCLGVIVDERGTVLEEHRVETPVGVDAILGVLGEVASELLARGHDIVGVGVGAPGLVDARGALRYAPNLPGVFELPLAGPLADRLAVPVVVENDASCAGWGEREAGAGRDRDDVVLVTLGTGIGAGVILGGRLFRGHHGFAGEVGHMVVDPSGPVCVCGQRGCWERFASGTGLGRLARDAAVAGRGARIVALAGGDVDQVRGEHVTAAAAEGDADATKVMQDFAWWVALGLANLANAFDPELFVLGGGLVGAGEILLAPVRRAFLELLDGADHRPAVGIVAAELGERAGAIGAALLARPG